MWDSIIFLLNSCFCLAMFTWWLMQFDSEYDSEYGCQTKFNHVPIIICAVSYVVYELLSFLLFYMPLKKTGRFLDISSFEYGKPFLTENQQLDDIETGQDEMEDDHRAVLLECHSNGSFTSRIQMSQNSLRLVTKLRKTVKRNLVAGTLTLIVGPCQYALLFLYL